MPRSPDYALEPLPTEARGGWDDLIASYETAELFHRTPWLDYLAASRGIDVRLWTIRHCDTTVGHFCAGLVRKGPFRVLGSPLKGWGTNSMGPVARRDFDQAAFLRALDDLAHQQGLAMTELESPVLAPAELEASGYEVVRGWTYRVPLRPDDPDAMWRAMDSAARNRVRKATRAGLLVEDTDDPAIADEFYDQYAVLVKHKGLAPPYSREYAQLLVRHLRKADLLFALRVRDGAGRVLATGLFPHDTRSVYFWGGASWHHGRRFCPNELLHWTLMRLAAARGLRQYDMCGHGRFKKKFGGTLHSSARWHKCHWRSARWARGAYEQYYHARRRLYGSLTPTSSDEDRALIVPPARYGLEPLTPSELAKWDDLVAPYGSTQLFHRRIWLEYLAATRPLELRFFAIRERGRTVGYFCGGMVRKGPFRILGSPLKGWTTNFMGPIANGDLNQEAFLRALDAVAQEAGLAMIEVENPILAESLMHEAGYVGVSQPTYVVQLTPDDPNEMWSRIDVKSRQKIRKARKLGLVVEETEDPAMAQEFYQEFVEVLARKNLSPPYGPETPQRLFRLLKPHHMLLALQIRDGSGAIVATGLFPHDDKTVYFWGGASRIAAWNLSPNDLLQWAVMEKAAAKGLRFYNMCGYGYFKSKFGGALQEPKRWHKSYSASAKWARRAYALYFDRRLRLLGWWHRVRSRPEE